jgi:RNA polymerase sigma factor (sigma-70 family)
MTDVELLEQHRGGSDSAFADLVRRHLGWVCGLARRRLRDAHLAEDVAQAVFVLLHRKAPRFAADRAMITWLHKTAWYASETAARSERRRHHRETEAAAQRPDSTGPADWQQLAPLLDQLVERLARPDREAILLHYYRDMSFADVGAQLGTTADAARKRVERAIEKLRRLAADQGAALSATALATHLTNYLRLTPPPGLVATATVAATAPAGSAMAAATTTIVKGAITMMASTKITFAALALLLVVVAGGICTAVWLSSSNYVEIPAPAAAPKSQPPPQTIQIWDAAGPYPKLAPFTAVRWQANVPQVQVNGTWYELVALNDLPVGSMIDFAKKNSPGNNWQKHFGEDLAEILTRMGHRPADRAKLQLRTLDTSHPVTLADVPMTEDNRWAVQRWNSEHP